MINYSMGVQIAWKISQYEASNNNSKYIEIDHIMLGILSLDKFLKQNKFNLDIDHNQLDYEKNKLYNTLKSLNIDINFMRRELREILPHGDGLPSDKIFHRSDECKKMFFDAESIANNFLTISHLFVQIINCESSYSSHLLISKQIDLANLKSEILFSFYKNN